MRDLQTAKKEALEAYKLTRIEWEKTRTSKNIKGDFGKRKSFCDAKNNCMRLGVII